MPAYEYKCSAGHVSLIFRRYENRLDPTPCATCGGSTEYVFPVPSRQCDGLYSYAPNIGNPKDHERRMAAIEEGRRTIKREQND